MQVIHDPLGPAEQCRECNDNPAEFYVFFYPNIQIYLCKRHLQELKDEAEKALRESGAEEREEICQQNENIADVEKACDEIRAQRETQETRKWPRVCGNCHNPIHSTAHKSYMGVILCSVCVGREASNG